MPFGIQPIHLIIIAVVALLIFGPSRLPEIGRGIGKAMAEFRKGAREMSEGFREEVAKPVDEPERKIYTPPAGTQPIDTQPTAAQPAVTTMTAEAEENSATTVFCNQCGAPNPGNAHFCNRWGSKIGI
jgi:TatA/E family protein of Tat protein translocase